MGVERLKRFSSPPWMVLTTSAPRLVSVFLGFPAGSTYYLNGNTTLQPAFGAKDVTTASCRCHERVID
jgi:hypothetical protein